MNLIQQKTSEETIIQLKTDSEISPQIDSETSGQKQKTTFRNFIIDVLRNS